MPFVTCGDTKVHYRRRGEGPVVVLVHGTAADATQWDWFDGPFTVLAPDLSGSGATEDAGRPISDADLAAQVVAVADDAGAAQFALVGHSLGAVVAARVAATVPDRVTGLFLHAGWVRTDAAMAERFGQWLELLHTDPSLFARTIGVDALGPRYWAGTTPAAHAELVRGLTASLAPGTDRQVEADLTVDLTGVLGRVTAPTLLLGSTHDRIVPAEQQEALHAAVTGSRLTWIDAGHGAPAEDPAGFARAVVEFLESL